MFACQQCGFAIEAENIRKHAPEGGAAEIGALCKQGQQTGSGPLDVRFLETDGKGHFALCDWHFEFAKQSAEIRIGTPVEYQEACIHRMRHAVERHIHRIGMTAEIIARLEQGDLVLPGKQPCGPEPRYTCADDGNAHRLLACPT